MFYVIKTCSPFQFYKQVFNFLNKTKKGVSLQFILYQTALDVFPEKKLDSSWEEQNQHNF